MDHIHSAFVKSLGGRGGGRRKYNEAVHHLFMDLKQAYDSVRKEVLYNIHNKFDIPMKLVRLIKMCPNETHSRV